MIYFFDELAPFKLFLPLGVTTDTLNEALKNESIHDAIG